MKSNNIYDYEKTLNKLTTAKQVYDLLNKNNISFTVSKDFEPRNRKDLSIWLDDSTRIYNSINGYIIQRWKKTLKTPTGTKRIIPVCHGFITEVDEYTEVEVEYTGKHYKIY